MSLSQITAERRASLIRKGSVQYNFHVILEQEIYHGLAELTFYLQTAKIQQDLEVDFSGKNVETVIVNNLEVDIDRAANFIFLPKEYLQKGRNRVSILYQNVYNIDQSGCISFLDNDNQLVYTDFEPYSANRVFPCFDQPDLKANIKLTVVTPSDWRVLSNQNPTTACPFKRQTYLKTSWGHEKSRYLLQKFSNKVGINTKITSFPDTKPLPSYIFCFAAGKYEEISTNLGTVPMSLFCAPSALENLKFYKDFIFDVTIKSMDFYEKTFGVDYPFVKYDQIFIRQCNFGAMENAGLVTFNEARVLRNLNPTQSEYYRFALIIAHQLSHHWFGNYVTMVWWDDVWLNESFAEWISCYCLQKLKGTFQYQKFQSAYSFFRDNKVYGYEEDERNSATHPIRGIVSNTLEAQSIFDGITYQKGASVLKQITYLVSQAKFSQRISFYFKRFPYGNATIDDLLFDLGQAFPPTVNVSTWKNTWLEKSSLNVFSIDWNQASSKITINQSSFDSNNYVLRTHQIKVGLFKSDGTYDIVPNILINGVESTVVDYSSFVGPYNAVLVNHDDETFVQNIIDPISLEFFKNNVDKINVNGVPDLFTRTNIWYNIRSMVKLSLVPVSDYVDLIANKLFIDKSYVIVDKILNNLSTYLDELVSEDIGNALRSRVLKIIYNELINVADSDTDRILILSNYYISYSRTESEILNLQNWLYNKDTNLTKRVLNNDQKWSIVKKIYTLTSLTNTDKQIIFQAIKGQDTDPARVYDAQTICDIIIANAAYFEQVYEDFKSTSVSLTEKKLRIAGWRNAYHYDWIVNQYQDRVYKDIITLSSVLSYDEFEFFYQRLLPIDSNLDYHISQYNQVVADLTKMGGMEQHCKNINKIIDDLSLRAKNIAFSNNALTQVRANNRFSYIRAGSISYSFHIGFVQLENYYTGMAQITFNLTSIPVYLPLDCICETIYTLKVNGAPVQPDIKGEFIFIDKKYLIQGQNYISIHYRNQYNNDGLGCMSYLETVSNPYRQYIYTKFQPYGAHRFVPCFDQPDLKAKAIFNIIVPDNWMSAANADWYHTGVYSLAEYQQNTLTKDIVTLQAFLVGKQGKFYNFFPTKTLSTYLYCVVAGEYYSVAATKLYKGIPMTLYSIQSYSSNLDRLAPFIFEMTTLSLQLYQTNFGVSYPYSKYDSVFCHEFKAGAMQNAGIITFNDTYLYPQAVSLEKMLAFASTIVHENSHNWFGNYVTMKWWDDLWLNESFADFIAHWCLEKIKDKVTTIDKYDSGWKLFLVRGVPGYREDQITETTHAVRSPVENTSIASTYFDRITYQKGSATLKQLMFLMGEANFFKGVQDYFQEFGESNGTIDDFLGKMQKYFTITDFTLSDWKNSWLLTPSLNVVSVTWSPADKSPTATLTINQAAYSSLYPTLRYHKTRVAFFKADNTYDTLDVLILPQATTTLTYNGSNNYVAVLVNVEYWSYFKYKIDPVTDPASYSYFTTNLNSIGDVLTRMIIWHDLNEAVRDSRVRVADFKTLFLNNIYTEKDDKIFQFQYSFIRDALNNYIPIASRAVEKGAIFTATYNALRDAAVKDDNLNRNKLLKDQLSVFASNFDQVRSLDLWRQRPSSNVDLAPYTITFSQGWQVVKLVYSQDQSTIYTRIIKESTYKDQQSFNPGIKAQLTLNTCNMIVTDTETLQDIYDNTFKKGDISLDLKASYAEGWNNFTHLNDLINVFKSQYFRDLVSMSRSLISNHFEFFYQNLKPIDDNLQDTINSYSKIYLQGGNMIGHTKVLKQIKYNYQLRLGLYAYNA